MAKQIYIDENGNEVLVSGTITNAGNLPLGSDFSDPTSTAGAIGDLTTLTTTDKSSFVGAVNEVNANKVSTTTYETITQPTINTAAGLSGNVYCKTIGHLVIVWGTIATTTALTSGTNILSGLPNKTQHSANVVTRAFDNSSGLPADDIVLYQPTTVLQLSGNAGASKTYTIYYMYYS